VVARVLWLNGTVGVGKTTVGTVVAGRLAASGETAAFVDTDALGDLAPRPVDDPFNTRLVARNLAAVAANFSEAGARSLVVAGVIEATDDLERYEQAVCARITLVRLVMPAPDIESRLRARHGDIDPGGLRWHLDRAPVLAAALDASSLPMIDVTNSGDPDTTARAVLAAVGWAPPPEG
jgi:hypothetical protein